jgi:hypothetical protein
MIICMPSLTPLYSPSGLHYRWGLQVHGTDDDTPRHSAPALRRHSLGVIAVVRNCPDADGLPALLGL